MSTDTVSDAVSALSLSEGVETGRPSTPPSDHPYDSDSNSSDTIKTIRPTITTNMSKSKSADTLRSPCMSDDVFAPTSGTSSAQPSISNAIARQADQSMETASNLLAGPQYAPRADRGTEINEYNAQGHLPPEAAIFCANLSNSRAAEELAASVHRAFDVFGKCYVSVKYDKHRNPYAVIQYELAEHARAALRTGNRTMLDGRQVRLEQSKGDRAVIITLLAGGTVTEHEARELLSPFGEIECIMSTDMIPGRSTTLPRGQYVRFAYFLDCRDALRRLHEVSEEHRIQLAAGLEPKRRIGPAGSEIYTSLGPARNNTDSKSIYVGNLPEECTDNEVHMAFSRFGTVENINLVRKTYPGGALNCFAFVEFASPIDADTASQTEIWIKGSKLRIEPKEYTARRNQRMAFESSPPPPPHHHHHHHPSSSSSNGNIINYRSPMSSPHHHGQSPPPRRRIPFRISPAASAALQERLALNNFHNNNTITGSFAANQSPPIMMTPPPRYNPYLADRPGYAGYAGGSPDAYPPHYESPTHGGASYHYRHPGMIGGVAAAAAAAAAAAQPSQELSQEAYADPAFMSAQYPPPPPPAPPRDYPYDHGHPGTDHQ